MKYAKNLNAATAAFAEKEGLANEETHKRAHWIPFAKPGSIAVKNGVVLIGDAAGICDPTTGAGISWALRSTRELAPFIQEAVGNKDVDSLDGYQQAYTSMLLELRQGMALRNILIAGLALTGREWPWTTEQVIKVLSGAVEYPAWAKKHPVLNKLGTLIEKLAVERAVN